MKKHLLLLCAFCVSLYGHSQKIYKLSSPDKNIGISISLSDKIDYDITYQNETLLEKGNLQLEIGNLQLGANPKLLKATSKSISPPIGVTVRTVPVPNDLWHTVSPTLKSILFFCAALPA